MLVGENFILWVAPNSFPLVFILTEHSGIFVAEVVPPTHVNRRDGSLREVVNEFSGRHRRKAVPLEAPYERIAYLLT